MLGGIPFIHGREPGVTLVHCNHRPFGQSIELGIGDDGGDLDNHILIRIQSGHFHIDPNEIAGVLHVLMALVIVLV